MLLSLIVRVFVDLDGLQLREFGYHLKQCLRLFRHCYVVGFLEPNVYT